MAGRLSGGLETTFALLGATRNEAAVAPLLAATHSPVREIRDAAFRALISQRHLEAEKEVLKRWPELPYHWRLLLSERADWLSHAIKEAFSGGETDQVHVAVDAAIKLRDYELIPFFVSMCEEKEHDFPTEAGRVLLALAESLCEELQSPRDYRKRTDPQQLRSFAIGSLESATGRYQHHLRPEVLEAVLLLATREAATVKGILQAPCDRTFPALQELFLHSPRPQIQKLLLSYLEDHSAPLAAIHAIAKRDDIAFLRQLCRRLSGELSPTVVANLKRIDNLAWLRDRSELWYALSDQEQIGAVQLVERTSILKDLALDALTTALKSGGVSARRAAAQALRRFQGAEANVVALQTLNDQDAEVRVAITKQLRERRSASTVKALVEQLDSPNAAERQAAQEQLQEYSFARYLQVYDTLDDQSRSEMGRLVRKIDKGLLSGVIEELESSSKHHKRRALEITELFQMQAEVIPQLQQLAQDDDSYVRGEAERLLTEACQPETESAQAATPAPLPPSEGPISGAFDSSTTIP